MAPTLTPPGAEAEIGLSVTHDCLARCMRRRADWFRRLQALLEEERELDELERRLVEALAPATTRRGVGSSGNGSFNEAVHAYEGRLIEQALDACGGVQREAAALLGILPTTLNEKLKRLGIRRDRTPHEPGPTG